MSEKAIGYTFAKPKRKGWVLYDPSYPLFLTKPGGSYTFRVSSFAEDARTFRTEEAAWKAEYSTDSSYFFRPIRTEDLPPPNTGDRRGNWVLHNKYGCLDTKAGSYVTGVAGDWVRVSQEREEAMRFVAREDAEKAFPNPGRTAKNWMAVYDPDLRKVPEEGE